MRDSLRDTIAFAREWNTHFLLRRDVMLVAIARESESAVAKKARRRMDGAVG